MGERVLVHTGVRCLNERELARMANSATDRQAGSASGTGPKTDRRNGPFRVILHQFAVLQIVIPAVQFRVHLPRPVGE